MKRGKLEGFRGSERLGYHGMVLYKIVPASIEMNLDFVLFFIRDLK